MRNILTATFFTYIFTYSINAQNPGNNIFERKHHIQITFGAPAMYCGLNYEYSLSPINKITLLPRTGVGFNIFNPSFGNEFNIHTGITMLFGNKPGKPEFGLGFIHYFMENYDFESEKNNLKYKPILYGLIAYRYEFENNPVSLKFGITPIVVFNQDRKVFFPLAELGFGFRVNELFAKSHE